MNVNDFNYIAQLLYQRSGLVITQEKAYLLESRLNPVRRNIDIEPAVYTPDTGIL